MLTLRTKLLVAALILIFSLVLIYAFRQVLPVFILALFLAYILTPVVNRMTKKRIAGRKIPRGMAIILIYLVLITGVGFGGTYFVINLANEMRTLVKDIPKYGNYVTEHWVPAITESIDRISAYMPDLKQEDLDDLEELPKPKTKAAIKKSEMLDVLTSTRFEIKTTKKGFEITPYAVNKAEEQRQKQEFNLTKMIDDLVADLIANIQSILLNLLNYGQALALGVVSSLVQTTIVLMMAAFIIIDSEKILRYIRGLFPRRLMSNLEMFLARLDQGLNGVVRGQLIICFINGTLTGIGLLIFGVKFALTLSILATVCSLIPIFGVVLSSVPIVLMAITQSFWSGLFILAWILGIHFIEGNFLNPKIIGRSAEIHPVLVIMALVAGEKTYGLFGALIAVPLFSILQTTFNHLRETVLESTPPVEPAPADDLVPPNPS